MKNVMFAFVGKIEIDKDPMKGYVGHQGLPQIISRATIHQTTKTSLDGLSRGR